MHTAQTKSCKACKSDFIIEPDDFGFYEKMQVPPPTFCSQCRLIRRLAWRNERSLHRRTCSRCNKSMISIFAPDTDMNIVCSPCWWSDAWSGEDYATTFDPAVPFLVQLKNLLRRVPVMNVYSIYTSLVNSEYVNMCSDSKNCYLTTYSDRNEDCSYGSFLVDSKNSLDTLMIKKCEFCYEVVNCQNCYRAFYSVDCESCANIAFSVDCIGCSDCFGCVGLRNKKYCLFNEQLTKEEYEKRLKEYFPMTSSMRESVQKRVAELASRFPKRFMHGRQNQEVSGEYIFNSKNTTESYVALGAENSKRCAFVENVKDSQDCTNYFMNSELMYDAIQSGGPGLKVAFCWWVIGGNTEVQYSMFTLGSTNMFGCVGMKKKQYCILNKQYSKEEYEKLRSVIIEQMNQLPYVDHLGNEHRYGEFFPMELSPFGYNETTAQEFFPLTKTEDQKRGLPWKELSKKEYAVTIKPSDLPQSIGQVDEEITKEVIGCRHDGSCEHGCTKAFRIIPSELGFYKQFDLPVPQLCPNCRHYERLALRNGLNFATRQCDCAGAVSGNGSYQNRTQHRHENAPCKEVFSTSYSADGNHIVYCEECYQQEVA